jgi:Holliday junction resolvase RusA-like endonuclease
MIYRLTINAHIPSKKNMLRRSRNGGMFHNKVVVDAIKDITEQCRCQWSGEPLVEPEMYVMFRILNKRADADNMLTTTLDCMVKAGVLLNDNCNKGPHPVTYDWIKADTEGADVYLEG